jgi:hypothetical protein
VGSTWANGQLIVCQNVTPNTSPSRFFKVNPQTGAIIDSVNFPFNGYVMGATFDGTDLWVVQWSPTSAVHKVSLSGVLIASYSLMSTYPYNCRAIMWDGQYLWMGANDVANNTRLYRMNTSGVVQLSFVSSASVGWYMDGEFDTNAPLGSNFCIVDNVGNTLKRLMITGSIVVGVDQSPSPAVAPDVAEGLAFDGDYLWHNGAYANQGLIWKIDDGLAALPLHITLTPLLPPIVVPAQGGSFNFNVSLTRLVGPQAPYSVWARIKNPDGSYTAPVLGPVTINTPVNVTVTRQRSQTVPGTWVAGLYTYLGYVNPTFAYPAVDSSLFTFTKSVMAGSGPYVWEATCSGEPFPGERAIASPAAFGLMKVYPNP